VLTLYLLTFLETSNLIEKYSVHGHHVGRTQMAEENKKIPSCTLFSWTITSRTHVKVGTHIRKKAGEIANSVNVNDVNENKGFFLLRSVSLAVGHIAETLCAAQTENITNVRRSLLYVCALLVQ
jgi:hypothetical protein